MRWMIYRWWCEGGGAIAWWVIESVFLRSPDIKGFWACLGDQHVPPDMPRRPETCVLLCNFILKHRGILRSSAILGSDSPQSNSRSRVTPFILRERPNVIKYAIAGYLRLPRTTPAPALMRVLRWQQPRNQGTPLAIRPNIMARYEEAAADLLYMAPFRIPVFQWQSEKLHFSENCFLQDFSITAIIYQGFQDVWDTVIGQCHTVFSLKNVVRVG